MPEELEALEQLLPKQPAVLEPQSKQPAATVNAEPAGHENVGAENGENVGAENVENVELVENVGAAENVAPPAKRRRAKA